jgi:hypothetical protein
MSELDGFKTVPDVVPGTNQTATQTKYDTINSEPAFDPSEGPAADLYTPKYTLGSSYGLVYPKDLESSRRGHAVFFEIYEVSPLTFSDVSKSVSQFISSGIKAAGDAAATATNLKNYQQAFSQDSIGSYVEAIPGSNRSTETNQIQFNTRTKQNTVATVALYMPETVNFSYEAQYDQLSLSSAASALPLVGWIAQGATSMLDSNEAARLGLSAAGYVFNPQQQVLFEGINFRSYDMSFTFTPSSEDETRNVNAIIKTFRYHAAPAIGGVGGFFFTPPSVFDVSFRYNGKTNPNLNLIKRSVLEKVDVNYAPNGWAAFEGNGAPIQTVMTLSFKEIVLVDKAEIKKGF